MTSVSVELFDDFSYFVVDVIFTTADIELRTEGLSDLGFEFQICSRMHLTAMFSSTCT